MVHVLFQFNNFLLVCQTVWIGIKQNYKIKVNMPLDGMQVSEQYLCVNEEPRDM